MADGGLSCPLCLVANDPADMLGVVIAHAVPVPDALIGLCKRCVLAIVKTAMATELISPEEVFDGDGHSTGRAPGPDSDSPAPAAGGPLVLPDPEAAEEAETPAGQVRRDAD